MIISIHNQNPGTPDDDQRPGVARYQVGQYWVDATGGCPTLAEVEAVRNPAPSFAAQKAAELALWKGQREQFIGRLASIASRLRVADPVGAASADAVATDLLGLFTAPAVVAATDIATYKAALKTRYVQAVMLATTTALAEFNKYNQ